MDGGAAAAASAGVTGQYDEPFACLKNRCDRLVAQAVLRVNQPGVRPGRAAISRDPHHQGEIPPGGRRREAVEVIERFLPIEK